MLTVLLHSGLDCLYNTGDHTAFDYSTGQNTGKGKNSRLVHLPEPDKTAKQAEKSRMIKKSGESRSYFKFTA
jgi:hypothetical protein